MRQAARWLQGNPVRTECVSQPDGDQTTRLIAFDRGQTALLVAGDHTHQPMYAAALAADARCRLIGLTDAAGIGEQRYRLNQQLAERLGIPRLDDFDRAVARDDVHIVSICAEPTRRRPLIVRAAEAGKHLYLDKPLAGLNPMGMWIALPGSPYVAAPKRNWLSAPALSAPSDVGYFLDCLQTGRDSEVNPATAALASQILLAAYRSAAEATS